MQPLEPGKAPDKAAFDIVVTNPNITIASVSSYACGGNLPHGTVDKLSQVGQSVEEWPLTSVMIVDADGTSGQDMKVKWITKKG